MKGDTFPQSYQEALGIDRNVLEPFVKGILEGGLDAVAAHCKQVATQEQATVFEFRSNTSFNF